MEVKLQIEETMVPSNKIVCFSWGSITGSRQQNDSNRTRYFKV